MGEDEYKAAVAAFIRTKGVTRCPTACALPTQGTIAADDRAALEELCDRPHPVTTAASSGAPTIILGGAGACRLDCLC